VVHGKEYTPSCSGALNSNMDKDGWTVRVEAFFYPVSGNQLPTGSIVNRPVYKQTIILAPRPSGDSHRYFQLGLEHLPREVVCQSTLGLIVLSLVYSQRVTGSTGLESPILYYSKCWS